jgi:hypothetical protein
VRPFPDFMPNLGYSIITRLLFLALSLLEQISLQKLPEKQASWKSYLG